MFRFFGGHWSSLEIIGGPWRSLEVIGGHCRSLEVIGGLSDQSWSAQIIKEALWMGLDGWDGYHRS